MVKKKKPKSIFKPGAKLTVEKVDMNSPEIQEEIRKIQKEQEDIQNRKKVDVNQLRNTVINI